MNYLLTLLYRKMFDIDLIVQQIIDAINKKFPATHQPEIKTSQTWKYEEVLPTGINMSLVSQEQTLLEL